MSDLEKLVELLLSCEEVQERDANDDWLDGELEAIADHLIDNGVTVQKWRDAKTDPPPIGKDVLLRFTNGTMIVGGLREDGGWYAITDAEWYTNCETIPEKWQPLPDASKED